MRLATVAVYSIIKKKYIAAQAYNVKVLKICQNSRKKCQFLLVKAVF